MALALLLKALGPFGAEVPDQPPPDGGGGEEPPPGEVGTLLTTATVEQYDTGAWSNQHITRGCCFAKGKLPAGNRVVAVKGGQQLQTQIDHETFWADGSIRTATLTWLEPSLNGVDHDVELHFLSGAQNRQGLTVAEFLAWADAHNWEVQDELDLEGGTWIAKATNGLQAPLQEGFSPSAPSVVGKWMSGPLVTAWRVHVPYKNGLATHRALRAFFDIYVLTDGAGNVLNVETDRTWESSTLYGAGNGCYFFEACRLKQNGVVKWSRDKVVPPVGCVLHPQKFHGAGVGSNPDGNGEDVIVTTDVPIFEDSHRGRLIHVPGVTFAHIRVVNSPTQAQVNVCYRATSFRTSTSTAQVFSDGGGRGRPVIGGKAYPQVTGNPWVRIDYSSAVDLSITLNGKDLSGAAQTVTEGPFNGSGSFHSRAAWSVIDSFSKTGTGTYLMGTGGFEDANGNGIVDGVQPGDWFIGGAPQIINARDTRTVTVSPRVEVHVKYPGDYLFDTHAIQGCQWDRADDWDTRLLSGDEDDWNAMPGKGADDKNPYFAHVNPPFDSILGIPTDLRGVAEFHIWARRETYWGQNPTKRTWKNMIRYSAISNWWPEWMRDPDTGLAIRPAERPKYIYPDDRFRDFNPTPGSTLGTTAVFGLVQANDMGLWYGVRWNAVDHCISHTRPEQFLAGLLTGKLYLAEYVQMHAQHTYLLSKPEWMGEGNSRRPWDVQARAVAPDVQAWARATAYTPSNIGAQVLNPRSVYAARFYAGITRGVYNVAVLGPDANGLVLGSPASVAPSKWRYDCITIRLTGGDEEWSPWMLAYMLEALVEPAGNETLDADGMAALKALGEMHLAPFEQTDQCWPNALMRYRCSPVFDSEGFKGVAGTWHSLVAAFPAAALGNSHLEGFGHTSGSATLSSRFAGAGRRLTLNNAALFPSHAGSLFVPGQNYAGAFGRGRIDSVDADGRGATVTILEDFDRADYAQNGDGGGMKVQFPAKGPNLNPGHISGVGSFKMMRHWSTNWPDWYVHGSLAGVACASYHPELQARANAVFDTVQQWWENDRGFNYFTRFPLSDSNTVHPACNTVKPKR